METVVVIVVLAVVSWAAWNRSKRRRKREQSARELALGAFMEDLRDRSLGPARPSGEDVAGDDPPGEGAGPATGAADGSFFVAGGGPGQVRTRTDTRTGEGAEDGAFDVRPGADLPTFDDVGGMDELKRELAQTFGLVLDHADRAAQYGITWNGILLHGPSGVGKTFLAQALPGEFDCNLVHVSTGDLVSSFAGESARNVDAAFATAEANRPCVLLFDEFDSIAQRRENLASSEERRTVNQLLTSLEEHRGWHDLVVVATTNDVSDLDPAVIRPGRFDKHIRIDLPDRAARREVFREALEHRPVAADIDLDELARRAEGTTPAAIVQVVELAALAAFRAAAAGGQVVRVTQQHLNEAFEERGGRDRPTVEDWDWDRLVLPDDVLRELRQLQALVDDPELARRFGVDPPSGVLLAGPPGTGKTTIAKVLAAQASCSFYPVSAADVTSKWAGESEQRIRDLFDRARANRPSIVFIDEIDALGSRRGAAGREWADRQLNQLLQEIDGLGGQKGILVIGATNRPEQLDAALVRGGRLSRTITIPLPDRADRRRLLEMLTRRMPTVAVDLAAVADATDGMSGADLEAVCEQAALNALVRAHHERRDGLELPAAIHQADFDDAVEQRRAAERTHRGQ